MALKNNTLKNVIALAVIATAVTSCARFGETSVTSPTNNSSLSPCTTSGAGNCEVTQATMALLDPNLLGANILSGVTIFGVAGTATAGSPSTALTSNIHRDKGTIPWSIVRETVTDAGVAYPNAMAGAIRAIPSILKDDDGYTGTSITYVDRSTWGGNTCGQDADITTPYTIDKRIAHCAAHPTLGAEATWDGTTKGNAGQSTWKLVTRAGALHSSGRAREVWRDERTGLLWSSLVSGSADNKTDKVNGGSGGGTSTDDNKYINWCKASGSNNITGNPAAEADPQGYCDNASYQNTGTGPATKAISACFEDGENFFTNTDTISNGIDSDGKAGLHSPAVSWRLPTLYDYQQANVDGIRFVMAEMGPNTWYWEWTASVYSDGRYVSWIFRPNDGVFGYDVRDSGSYAVRCVGR